MMLKKEEISEKLHEIIHESLNQIKYFENNVEGYTYNDYLHIILYDSIQATYFVTVVEEEFEVEFEDDEIDFEFFSDEENIISKIMKSLKL